MQRMFHDYSLSKLGPLQVNLKVYNSANMSVIGSSVLHHKTRTLVFNITDLEGSVLLSCADILLLGLLQATNKLNKKYPVVQSS